MQTLKEKVETVALMSDCERCVASKAVQTIIDVIRPDTGRTWIYGKTVEDCRKEYPDTEEMTIDEFCAWKAKQQRMPITWTATTPERFEKMLGCLPPALMLSGGFLVGEPFDHDAGNGQPRFEGFRQRGDVYEVGNRPMTRAEFRAQMTNVQSEGIA
jgi:hypothetical protein